MVRLGLENLSPQARECSQASGEPRDRSEESADTGSHLSAAQVTQWHQSGLADGSNCTGQVRKDYLGVDENKFLSLIHI